jgi:hypothetical protein
MTKLGSALGSAYEAKRKELLIRKFELGGHTFKVRVPLVSESDEIYRRISEPSSDRIDSIYQSMVKPLMQFKDEGAESFKFTDDDVLVEGRSMREAAKAKCITETRITEFIKLLVPEIEGESLADLTYEEIEVEWPLSVQLAICEKIGEVISPTYREARKN